MTVTDTQRKILESGKRWFLEKGYKSAPLRAIVKDAGFTLGAFYGYYKTKEDLFYALTDDTAEGFIALIHSVSEKMSALPPQNMIYSMLDCYIERLPDIADYICAHRDEMTLIMRCSEGTKYENFLNRFRMQNDARISDGVKKAAGSGKQIHDIDPELMDLLMHSYYSILAKIVLEENDRDRIVMMMRNAALVYRNGIMSLMEEKKNA